MPGLNSIAHVVLTWYDASKAAAVVAQRVCAANSTSLVQYSIPPSI